MKKFNSAVTDTINSMMDDVCRTWGFEVPETIRFITIADSGADFKTVQKEYKKLMNIA